jgi:hypothetical protein
MAPPDGAAVSDDAMGLTQRELLMEMREDIKGLKTTVDAIAKDQALGVERRAAMQRSADSIYARLDGHDRDLDRMQAWQNRADGAMVLARWALAAPASVPPWSGCLRPQPAPSSASTSRRRSTRRVSTMSHTSTSSTPA